MKRAFKFVSLNFIECSFTFDVNSVFTILIQKTNQGGTEITWRHEKLSVPSLI